MNVVWVIYLAGVVVGLWMGDSRAPARVGLALLWPLGPLAFIVTLTGLVLASLIAFPVVGALAAAAAVIAWLVMN